MPRFSRLQVIKLLNKRLERIKGGGEATVTSSFDGLLRSDTRVSSHDIDQIMQYVIGKCGPSVGAALADFKVGGALRNYLQYYAKDFNGAIKVLLQEIVTYAHTLSTLSDSEKLNYLEDFPNRLRAEGAYAACIQGVKERLEGVLLKLNSSVSYEDSVVERAHDQVMYGYLEEFRKKDNPRFTGVHWITILNWIVGVTNDKTDANTGYLYREFGSFAFRIDVYRKYRYFMATQMAAVSEGDLLELMGFMEKYPVYDASGIENLYDSKGKIFHRGGSKFKTMVAGEEVICTKYAAREAIPYVDVSGKLRMAYIRAGDDGVYRTDAGRACTVDAVRNYKVTQDGKEISGKKTPIMAGYYYTDTEGNQQYLTGTLYNARRFLEEKLKALSIIDAAEELSGEDYAGLVKDDYSAWLPSEQLKDRLRRKFFPLISIEAGKTVLRDGEKSFAEGGAELRANSTVQEAFFMALKSENLEEKAAAIHELYNCWGIHNRWNRESYVDYKSFVFNLGLSLLSKSELAEYIAQGYWTKEIKRFFVIKKRQKITLRDKIFDKAIEFMQQSLESVKDGVPHFMASGLLDELSMMKAAAADDEFTLLIKLINEERRVELLMRRIGKLNDFSFLRDKLIALLSDPLTPAGTSAAIMNGIVAGRARVINYCLAVEAGESKPSKSDLICAIFSNAEFVRRGRPGDIVLSNQNIIKYLCEKRDFESLRFLLCETEARQEVLDIINSPEGLVLKHDFIMSVLTGGCLHTARIIINAENVNDLIMGKGTPLQIAIKEKHLELAKFLLAQGADPKDEEFLAALRCSGLEKSEIIEALLESRTINFHQCFSLAASYDMYDIADLVLSKCKDIEKRDAGGATFLHLAAQIGNLSMVHLLVNRGSDIKARDSQGASALNRALMALCVSREAIKLFLKMETDAYQDFEFILKNGEVGHAIKLLQIIRVTDFPLDYSRLKAMILDAKASDGRVDFVYENLVSQVSQVIELPSQRYWLGEIFKTGDTSMCSSLDPRVIAENAAYFMQCAMGAKKDDDTTLELVRIILNAVPEELKREVVSRDQGYIIEAATSENNIKTFQFLIENGANPNILIKFEGLSLLQLAILTKAADVTRYIIENQINDPDILNNGGATAINLALAVDDKFTAEKLSLFDSVDLSKSFKYALEKEESQIDFLVGRLRTDRQFYDCFKVASAMENINQAALDLLLSKVTSQQKNELLNPAAEKTPLHSAVEKGNLGNAALLLKEGADINHCNPFSPPFLFTALEKADTYMFRYLLGNGARADLCNALGESPLYVAISMTPVKNDPNRKEMIDILCMDPDNIIQVFNIALIQIASGSSSQRPILIARNLLEIIPSDHPVLIALSGLAATHDNEEFLTDIACKISAAERKPVDFASFSRPRASSDGGVEEFKESYTEEEMAAASRLLPQPVVKASMAPRDLSRTFLIEEEVEWLCKQEPSKPTTIYEPLAPTGFWATSNRRNDFRVLDDLYERVNARPLKEALLGVIGGAESKEEKIKLTMISNVIMAAVDSDLVVLGADGSVDCKNIVRTLFKAKELGGIANIANKKILPTDVELSDQENLFSKLVQQYNKEAGIFSGRVEKLKNGDAMQFGLRTTFLPNNVVDFFEQKNHIDSIALQCCKSYTNIELIPMLQGLNAAQIPTALL